MTSKKFQSVKTYLCSQQLKIDLDKAIKCLEKETGEIVNLDELLKDDTQWKGRAQKIEVLKAQVK